MKSLKLALKLSERLQADKYHEQLKYPMQLELVKIEEGEFKGSYTVERLNPATMQPATKLYNQLAREEWRRREKRQDRDRELLYHIIAKYGTYWWD